MKAVRVHRFGGPEVMMYEEVVRPVPAPHELLVKIEAAGVGPWDAWIRSGRSALPQPLPLTLGSDIAGVVEEVGSAVDGFAVGDEIYGVTNPQFTGGYAQFAAVTAAMVAGKPKSASFIDSASVPVVAVTAWQMLFEHANVRPGQRIMILGASGSVGSMAIQFARRNEAYTIAVTSTDDADRLRHLGAQEVINLLEANQLQGLTSVDAVIDAAGGEEQRIALSKLKRGGVLISSVSPPDPAQLAHYGVSGSFFLVNATTKCLADIAALIDRGELSTRVGTVLAMDEANVAHQMLDGTRAYARGKIVLQVSH